MNLALAVIGLCIDLYGLILFQSFSQSSQLQDLIPITSQLKGSKVAQNSSHITAAIYGNMHAIFLHAACDLLLHVGLLVATWLQESQDVMIANGAVFIVIGAVIIHNVYPLASQMVDYPFLSEHVLFISIHTIYQTMCIEHVASYIGSDSLANHSPVITYSAGSCDSSDLFP